MLLRGYELEHSPSTTEVEVGEAGNRMKEVVAPNRKRKSLRPRFSAKHSKQNSQSFICRDAIRHRLPTAPDEFAPLQVAFGLLAEDKLPADGWPWTQEEGRRVLEGPHMGPSKKQ